MAGKLALLTPIHAGVIQFFDPLQSSYEPKSIKLQYQGFIADDPMAIKDFLDDWHGKYTPESNQNIAILDSRFDFGLNMDKNYYLGYFYQYNVFIDTQKDFTDLFYAVKNKNDLQEGRSYALDLDIDGIKQHGLIFSADRVVYDNDKYSITLAGSFYLSYGLDMQDGYISGDAKALGAKDYEIGAYSSYYYTHNYLYHLGVKDAHGYGYGTHVGINFENKEHLFSVKFLVNDLLSKMYWKDLPYSKIEIETKNKSYDKDGYVKYSPSIKGLEVYRDYTQNLERSYKLEATMMFDNSKVIGGVDSKYSEYFPYIKVLYAIDDMQTVEVLHESRFGSFGLGYGYKNFSISVLADDFSDISSFGLNSSFFIKF